MEKAPERQSDRAPERQIQREGQRDKETESQRDGETEGYHGAGEVSARGDAIPPMFYAILRMNFRQILLS